MSVSPSRGKYTAHRLFLRGSTRETFTDSLQYHPDIRLCIPEQRERYQHQMVGKHCFPSRRRLSQLQPERNFTAYPRGRILWRAARPVPYLVLSDQSCASWEEIWICRGGGRSLMTLD